MNLQCSVRRDGQRICQGVRFIRTSMIVADLPFEAPSGMWVIQCASCHTGYAFNFKYKQWVPFLDSDKLDLDFIDEYIDPDWGKNNNLKEGEASSKE